MVGGSNNPFRRTGFTLLELLVVLAIAGALLALVPPVISAVVPGTKARVAALDLAATLRAARNTAITRSTSIDVTFDTESASYVLAGSSKTELPRGVALVILDRSGYVSETRHAVGHLHGPDPTYTLRFYPDGSCNGLATRLGAADGGYVVAVDWLMGRVSITGAKDDAA